HRRRNFIEGKMLWINHAHAPHSPEPQSSIRGPGGRWTEARCRRTASYSVKVIENCDLDRPHRINQPGVDLRAHNTDQAAGHIQPERVSIVFHHPMHSIAGQPVLALQRGDAAVFQPAETTFGRGPERTVAVESQTADLARAESVGG